MKLDGKSLSKHEIIGLQAEVINSKNKSNIGIKGKIIDETKETIIIKDKKQKRLFKNNIILKIKINNQTIEIQGKKLAGRPKDRITK